MIPLSIPSISNKEFDLVKKTISKNWISTFGDYKNKFDNSLCKITKSKYSISVSSGTAALHLALRVLGVKEGHEVVVPSLTFIASVNVIKYLNSNPIFMDVDENHNLDISKTIYFLKKNTFTINKKTFNKKTRKRISVVIITHMWGNALDFSKLASLCKKKKYFYCRGCC